MDIRRLKIDKLFYIRLDRVLKHYHIDHITRGGMIYIKRWDSKDKELMLNYTSKAISDEWLKMQEP